MEITEEDIVALGGDLDPEKLMLAYRNGIFPWPIDGMPLPWFCPAKRAILDFNDLHIPRSLLRAQRRLPFLFTIDTAFDEVISGCAIALRKDQDGTWITPEMLQAYKTLHRMGYAHSIEVWEYLQGTGTKNLVGGLYGVDAGGYFSAESMFHHKSYASKLGLLYLIDHLKSRGLDWIDIQVLTPHMQALGARLIPRSVFLSRMAQTQRRIESQDARLFSPVVSGE